MKKTLLLVCAAALASTLQAATFCTVSQGTWCEIPGLDAGQFPDVAQYTSGVGSLNSIQGAVNGLGGADLYRINILDPTSFSASYTPQAGTGPGGTSIPANSNAALYLFSLNGMGIEANDDSSGLGSFSGPAGIYLIGITGNGNVPQFGPQGSTSAIFSPFVVGQDSLPVSGAGVLSAYSGAGCGINCSGGYDITLNGADYSGTPEPATLALTGSMITLMGLVFRFRRDK